MKTYYKDYKMKYIKKTITLTEDHSNWINKNSINLTWFVRKEIDKKLKGGKKNGN